MTCRDSKEELVREGLVTIAEAASFLGIGRTSVYMLMDRGELAYCKLGRSRRIPRAELARFAASAMIGGGQ